MSNMLKYMWLGREAKDRHIILSWSIVYFTSLIQLQAMAIHAVTLVTVCNELILMFTCLVWFNLQTFPYQMFVLNAYIYV